MAKRKIIKIDEDKCNGCGLCIPNCPEGAIQIIDKKARLISDLFCDGLGACIGHCPQGAITIEERESAPYEGPAPGTRDPGPVGCPGARMMDFSQTTAGKGVGAIHELPLQQWPIQLHLVPPSAPFFKGKDVVLAADCVAYALPDFHEKYLKGKSLAIACPKLDSDQEIYVEKITDLIDEAKINTLSVMTMEVPCCMGLVALAKEGAEKAKRKVPLKHIVVSIMGEIVREEWL